MIDELELVRRIGAEDEVPDAAGARERVRARVLDGGGAAPGAGDRAGAPRRSLRLLGALVPAAAVAAGVALVVVLGGGGEPDGGAAASQTLTTTAAAPAPEAPSLFPPPDEFLYVKTRSQYLSCTLDGPNPGCEMQPRRVREVWMSEQRDSRLVERPGTTTPEGLGRTQLVLGNRRFSHQELAAYAPTPRELLDELQRGRAPGQGGETATYPFVQITDALREMPMPAQVRRALVEALPLVPGVQELGQARDSEGRLGLAYARTLQGRREEVIVDPVTATMLEEQQTVVDERGAPQGFQVGDRVGHAVYLERAVVANAGDRP
ncbi:CU044_5270 family protein [Conexibacter sp. SYSU D00693]|uniref:CU044_5270 family protein n=1 Tax=Conexibacter sp. SYSU D00693 TaxID=2812560 RepID=UPI00196AFEC1|nr:CU044_5270 family protein [Conexibacter sp. SYSU D00693]